MRPWSCAQLARYALVLVVLTLCSACSVFSLSTFATLTGTVTDASGAATLGSTRSGEDISKLALNVRATNNTSPIVVATLAQVAQQDARVTSTQTVDQAGPRTVQFSLRLIRSSRSRVSAQLRWRPCRGKIEVVECGTQT